MTSKPTTVDEYIGLLEPPARDRLVDLRALVRSTAPGLDEQIKWGAPAYVHPDGVIMLMLSAHKGHANIVFTPSTREHFADQLTELATGKGSVQLPYGDGIPAEVLRRMVQHRVEEYERDGVKWM